MLAIPEKLALLYDTLLARQGVAMDIGLTHQEVSDFSPYTNILAYASGIFGIGALLYRRVLHCQGLPNSLDGPAVLNPVFYALIVISFPINLPSSSLSQRTFFMTSLFSVPELLQE